MYEGQFKEGKYNGVGIYYWPNAIKYYGNFVEGKIEGIGMRYFCFLIGGSNFFFLVIDFG